MRHQLAFILALTDATPGCPLILWVRALGIFCSLSLSLSEAPPPYHKSGEESRVYYTGGGGGGVGVKNGLFIRRHKRDIEEREEGGQGANAKKMFAICDCDGGGAGGQEKEA